MLRTKLLAAGMATGLALSGAYAVSASAAPKSPGNPATMKSPAKRMDAKAGPTATLSDIAFDKTTYQIGETYELSGILSTNANGAYVIGFNPAPTNATCTGAGEGAQYSNGKITYQIADASEAAVQTRTFRITCKLLGSPVNDSILLTAPEGVNNLTPKSDYTVGGSLPGTPTPTPTATKKPTPTKKPGGSGGLASTGV